MNVFKLFSKETPSSNFKLQSFTGYRVKTFSASNPRDFDRQINDWFLGADSKSIKIVYTIAHPSPVGSTAFSLTLVCEVDYRGACEGHPKEFE